MTASGTPAEQLAALGEEFFDVQNRADPLAATLMGAPGYDALLPDPSREGSRRAATRLAHIETRLARIDLAALDEAGRVNHAVLGRLAWAARADLVHGLWEANASAEGYASPPSTVFMSMPSAVVADDEAVESYRARLEGLGSFFDAVRHRYLQAASEGRIPTATGVQQLIEQLSGHLAAPLSEDVLCHPFLGPELDAGAFAAEAERLVATSARPAMERLVTALREELLPVARDDEHVGIRFVPGGEEGYRDAVRRHTTTRLDPDEIHQIGLETVAALEVEWVDLGGRALGGGDVPGILRRLREDRSLRFETSAEIVATVTAALQRAEAARDGFFPPYRIADCVIEEINPIEAGNAALAHYRPPAGDGSRPGAHCLLTTDPGERFRYEYEALAFHESTPGHHLQIASAQTLRELPDFRRYVDAQLCGYVEGWGLYCERLADEMGLYTSDLMRLGMLSFDSLRACRLVVDTGMHHLGWSRQQAAAYMWEHTATTAANVDNEIRRYIGWPGQALAYLIGRREIRRLRALAEERLGERFDLRQFHGTVLGEGAVPLDVLEQLVHRWIEATAA